MGDIYEHFLEELRPKIVETVVETVHFRSTARSAMSKSPDLSKDDLICRYLFKNYRKRGGVRTGLRLSTQGFLLLKKYYDCYKIELEHNVNGKHLVALENKFQWPYYLFVEGKADGLEPSIYLFNADDAAWLKIAAGNLDRFLEMI